MKYYRKHFLTIILIVSLVFNLKSQEVISDSPQITLSFVDQELSDVLYIIGDIIDMNIIIDETIVGKITYYFNRISKNNLLNIISERYNLYTFRSNDYIRISKINLREISAENFSIKSSNVPLRIIINKVSEYLNRTIIYDNIPNINASIREDKLNLDKFMKIIGEYLGDNYKIQEKDGIYKISLNITGDNRNQHNIAVSADNLYSIDIQQGSLDSFLKEFFQNAKLEFLYLSNDSPNISNLMLSARSFEDTLRLILLQVNKEFTIIDNIYYIYDSNNASSSQKFSVLEIYKPQNKTPDAIVKLLPSQYISGGKVKIDSYNQSLILNANKQELDDILQFIYSIDGESKHKIIKIQLKSLLVEELLKILPEYFPKDQIIPIKGNALLANVTDSQLEFLNEFISKIDSPLEYKTASLNYILPEILINNLPAEVDKKSFIKTPDTGSIIIQGSGEQIKQFLRIIRILDKPPPKIRYEVLVINQSTSSTAGFQLGVQVSPAGTIFSTPNQLIMNELLNFNFNIVTTLGLNFTIDLSSSLVNKRSKVYANTTLNALSGEKVNFRNTTTTRYIESQNTNADTVIGSTKEVVSGLIIDLQGWVTGNGTVTMDVSTTVSRESSSEDAGALPQTTEKTLKTHVRAMSGEIVTLGGLSQEEGDTVRRRGLPLLGSTADSYRSENIIIYIIPYITFERTYRDNLESEVDFIYQTTIDGLWKQEK